MIRGELARRCEDLIAARAAFVVATVVRAQRPTSVLPGDAALVAPDGAIEGFVGGLCAEDSVRLHALRVMETGEPLLLRILPSADEDGDASAAEGAVTVHNPCLSGGALEVFLEPQLPAPVVLVLGETPIAAAIADLGERLGYEVVRGGGGGGRQEPAPDDAAVVVASHGRDEERVLAAALHAGVPYVGVVASDVRGASLRAALDVPDELRSKLRTPAGLPIAARTPGEIAVAILAEIVATLREAGDGVPAAAAEVPAAAAATVAPSGGCCHGHAD